MAEGKVKLEVAKVCVLYAAGWRDTKLKLVTEP